MRVKKFICIGCGAPKVNEYKSPYIVCDYCGSFTDIDYTLGFDLWNTVPDKTAAYNNRKFKIEAQLQEAIKQNDKNKYREIQYEYWNIYYKAFPFYLPPSINEGEEYKLYLDVCANSSTDYVFDNYWKEKGDKITKLQNGISYYKSGKRTYANSKQFFEMAEYYIDYMKESMKDFYANPDYAIMHEVLPHDIHMKMKLSMFVQIWITYLPDEDADKLLKLTGFSQQYVDIEPPKKEEAKCEHCAVIIKVPEGSFKTYCESCYKTTRVKNSFNCMSCGAKNNIPSNPAKPVDCEYCGTENRLIKPLFG